MLVLVCEMLTIIYMRPLCIQPHTVSSYYTFQAHNHHHHIIIIMVSEGSELNCGQWMGVINFNFLTLFLCLNGSLIDEKFYS